jgi:hypothetical protein
MILPPAPTDNPVISGGISSLVSYRGKERKGGRGVAAQRLGTLLVPVPGLSGTTYPPGTTVTVRGRGATVDAFVNGDWLPLSWWEFSDGLREDIADR